MDCTTTAHTLPSKLTLSTLTLVPQREGVCALSAELVGCVCTEMSESHSAFRDTHTLKHSHGLCSQTSPIGEGGGRGLPSVSTGVMTPRRT